MPEGHAHAGRGAHEVVAGARCWCPKGELEVDKERPVAFDDDVADVKVPVADAQRMEALNAVEQGPGEGLLLSWAGALQPLAQWG